MANSTYVAPEAKKKAFTCPNCTAYAAQSWHFPQQRVDASNSFYETLAQLCASRCSHCGEACIWWGPTLVVPAASGQVLPHPEMPADIRNDFEEARLIANKSPRSAAALLRLCIQKLCKALGEPGKDINTDISSLVQKGLPPQLQQSLDIVRVVGNEQVHPGTLDVRDDPEIVTELFQLVNFIVEDRIARPKAIQELYMRLPESKRKAIEARDKTSHNTATTPPSK